MAAIDRIMWRPPFRTAKDVVRDHERELFALRKANKQSQEHLEACRRERLALRAEVHALKQERRELRTTVEWLRERAGDL